VGFGNEMLCVGRSRAAGTDNLDVRIDGFEGDDGGRAIHDRHDRVRDEHINFLPAVRIKGNRFYPIRGNPPDFLKFSSEPKTNRLKAAGGGPNPSIFVKLKIFERFRFYKRKSFRVVMTVLAGIAVSPETGDCRRMQSKRETARQRFIPAPLLGPGNIRAKGI